MSDRNFVEYNDAMGILTTFANEIKKRVLQFSTEPTVQATTRGDIIQYIGATTANFTHGYFYERTESGFDRIDVQSESGTIPTALSDLNDDSTHRLVTDTEKASWNGKAIKDEYATFQDFPVTGNSNTFYISQNNNRIYRWDGTGYVEINPASTGGLELGETSSTAYRGDRGKAAYDHATDANKISSQEASGLYKIAVTDEGHIASVTPVVKNDILGLGIPGQDTTYTPAAQAPGVIASDGSAGSSTNYAREDHTHAIVVGTGDANGQVKIAGQNASVAGLGSAAYTTFGTIPVNPQDTTGLNIWIETA